MIQYLRPKTVLISTITAALFSIYLLTNKKSLFQHKCIDLQKVRSTSSGLSVTASVALHVQEFYFSRGTFTLSLWYVTWVIQNEMQFNNFGREHSVLYFVTRTPPQSYCRERSQRRNRGDLLHLSLTYIESFLLFTVQTDHLYFITSPQLLKVIYMNTSSSGIISALFSPTTIQMCITTFHLFHRSSIWCLFIFFWTAL